MPPSGGERDSCLLIREVGFTKRGKMSVGVARQRVANSTRVSNCQVGLFAALCRGDDFALINACLYLPEEWASDKARCIKAGVPGERMSYLSKKKLALRMVADAKNLGLRFGWVGVNFHHDVNMRIAAKLDMAGDTFVVETGGNQLLYEQDPAPCIPRVNKRLRKLKRYVSTAKAVRTDEWVSRNSKRTWLPLDGKKTHGDVFSEEMFDSPVWLWKRHQREAHRWQLMVLRNQHTGGDYSYWLSNAGRERLAFMLGQRNQVESALAFGNRDCGMSDYQVRGWSGWHHHMAMVMMAMLIVLEIRVKFRREYPFMDKIDAGETLVSNLLPQTIAAKAAAPGPQHARG